MIYRIPERLEMSTREVNRQVRCGATTAERWCRDGMTWVEADRFACALGLYPTSLWPDWDMPLDKWLRIWALEESWELRPAGLREAA